MATGSPPEKLYRGLRAIIRQGEKAVRVAFAVVFCIAMSTVTKMRVFMSDLILGKAIVAVTILGGALLVYQSAKQGQFSRDVSDFIARLVQDRSVLSSNVDAGGAVAFANLGPAEKRNYFGAFKRNRATKFEAQPRPAEARGWDGIKAWNGDSLNQLLGHLAVTGALGAAGFLLLKRLREQAGSTAASALAMGAVGKMGFKAANLFTGTLLATGASAGTDGLSGDADDADTEADAEETDAFDQEQSDGKSKTARLKQLTTGATKAGATGVGKLLMGLFESREEAATFTSDAVNTAGTDLLTSVDSGTVEQIQAFSKMEGAHTAGSIKQFGANVIKKIMLAPKPFGTRLVSLLAPTSNINVDGPLDLGGAAGAAGAAGSTSTGAGAASTLLSYLPTSGELLMGALSVSVGEISRMIVTHAPHVLQAIAGAGRPKRQSALVEYLHTLAVHH
tara:strand:+ start:7600 stop:8946 length:1347 start_codon:yes stop_codon:yes gene_type:complete